MYPIEKYRFYTNGNKVIAVSTYAGKTVRGVAKCAPEDKFDFERGKKIAAARCEVKVAKRRMNRANTLYRKAIEVEKLAWHRANKMQEYHEDAHVAFEEALDHLNNLIVN